MIIKSLDPRIDRAALDDESKVGELSGNEHFQTYEVFQQVKRGTHHQHVGSVHAPNAEMAMLFAKEQYCRRGAAVNLWVVKTADVFVTEYQDADIFETTEDKLYRDPNSYKVMDRINAFKARNNNA
ncbi:MAG: 1,2-phenylacetyl-CoA epoxidase subunit B [Bacteroidetes bacterium]|jgi:ring-1,2-phenylacetyl-CoA epoxidase subunit PaaB|nr:1,2-phenylacetyl-CoA epoxidase subunit B [Bacteroidota bacterium]